MRGGIYSDQKCFTCNSSFGYDETRQGLFCPVHPDQEATKRFRVKFGRETSRRFKTFADAQQFLDVLRYESDRGIYEPSDYQQSDNRDFSTLVERWLRLKQKELRKKSYANLRNYMKKARMVWGGREVQSVGREDIETFLNNQKVSGKTRANMKSCLHSFWSWLARKEIISPDQLPDFPEVTFKLGWRRTIDKQIQLEILFEIQSISHEINPKIWLGIKWLCTYVTIRPGELISIKEKDIDLLEGIVSVPGSKLREVKKVHLLDEDINILKILQPGNPEQYFFRHPKGISGAKEGSQFGPRYLYKWWKKACANLGIEGVDLYGGTKHSSAVAIEKDGTPEQIRYISENLSNKAFDRYFQLQNLDLTGL